MTTVFYITKPMCVKGLAIRMDRLDDGDARFHLDPTRDEDRDIEVKIHASVDLAELNVTRNVGLRLAAFYVNLTNLAREDERLASLLSCYRIEVKHGDRQLWPVEKEMIA